MDWVVLGHSKRRRIFGESNEVTTDKFILFIQFFTCKCKELNSSKQVKHTKHVSLPPVLLVHWPEGSSRSGERSRCDRLHRRDAGREGERHHRSGHLCSDESHRRYAAPHTVTGFLCAHESWNVENQVLSIWFTIKFKVKCIFIATKSQQRLPKGTLYCNVKTLQ